MNPLRTQRFVEIGGQKYALRLELFDFACAQKEIGIPLAPIGQTEFWADDGNPQYKTLVLLYVALRRSIKGLTLDWLIENVSIENASDVDKVLEEELADFFRRLRTEAERRLEKIVAEAETSTGESTGTVSSPSPASVSGSRKKSSGASRSGS